ncbi:hypothetical protein D3C84_761530 [compost metagenome]
MRQAACDARVVSNHRPTLSARQQLAVLHRKGTCRAEATNMPTGVPGAMCLGAIFDQWNGVRLGDRHQAIQVGDRRSKMDHSDGSRTRRDCALKCHWIKAPGLGLHVSQDGDSIDPEYRGR